MGMYIRTALILCATLLQCRGDPEGGDAKLTRWVRGNSGGGDEGGHVVSLLARLSLSDATAASATKRAGLYKNKTFAPELAKTVLVTAANSAYLSFLTNWEAHAESLGLDWLVIAMDEDVLKHVEADRAILVNGTKVSGSQHFWSPGFNLMSCNKILQVLLLMQQTGLNVVFSDPDNVFRKDPFAPSTSLGSAMRSGDYHYLYELNHQKRSPPEPSDAQKETAEGNTGFYWVSAQKDLQSTALLFEDTLSRCHNNPKRDDQTHFWGALRALRQGDAFKQDGQSFECARLCGQQGPCDSHSTIFEYCGLDPVEFATGKWDSSHEERVVAYHANFAVGTPAKIAKLEKMQLWEIKANGLIERLESWADDDLMQVQ